MISLVLFMQALFTIYRVPTSTSMLFTQSLVGSTVDSAGVGLLLQCLIPNGESFLFISRWGWIHSIPNTRTYKC